MMNERIKELMNEVIEFRLDPDSKHYEAQVSPEDLEMFAELIVRECIGVCESMQLIGPYKEVQDATLKDAAVQIKQHFGVEVKE
jgi:hypothetical protein